MRARAGARVGSFACAKLPRGKPLARALIAILLFGSAAASAQSVRLEVDTEEIYAGLPFVLSLAAEGFEETPEPEAPDLVIEGARITYLGVSPSVSQQIQIVNGRRSEWREVTFVYRWRVQPDRAGRYVVPALTVVQGDRSAVSRAASFDAGEVAEAADMFVRMLLPDRPVWVGETFDAVLEWLIARDVESYEFVVPLFHLEHLRFESRSGDGQSVTFAAGTGEVALPMERDSVVEDGVGYTRLRFPARVSVGRPGTLDLAPVRVAARLQAGTYRDAFGFRRARTALFQATGERRQLVVRPLPESGRPPNFVNAIGTGFSLDVAASRSVVQVGDPIELTVVVRGDGDLEGLSLPPLGGEGGLPPALFSVPDTPPFGVVDAEANAKTFELTARVRSAEAREIPPVALSYFDPVAGTYATTHSRPVALSVRAGDVIGAADVTVAAGAPAESGVPAAASGAPGSRAGTPSLQAAGSLVGADMSLSAPARTLAPAWGAGVSPLPMALLYVLPLLAAALHFAWMRSAGRRRQGREIARARRAVEAALAAGGPARETAPEVLSALRALAGATGREGGLEAALAERLETTAFDPAAGREPLDARTVAGVRTTIREWVASKGRNGASVALMLPWLPLLAIAAWGLSSLPAEAGGASLASDLEHAREAHASALAEPDRVRRTRLFAQAERSFRGAAAGRRDAPDLLVDWGNAALGAGDTGRAVLAWRRALVLDPGHGRALRNLGWVRDRAPAWLPRPASGGALDSLLFWRGHLSIGQRHWVGAGAFALAVALSIPWSRRRAKALRRVAFVPWMVWVTATGSALLATDGSDAAVLLVDGTALRSADSLGAPPSFGNPLPSGTELTLVEERERWVRAALADGTQGWLPASTVVRVGS